MADKVVPPSLYIEGIVADLLHHGEQLPGKSLLYEEMNGGFKCRYCRFAFTDTDPHGHCEIMAEPIHLDNGCCVAWQYNPELLMRAVED